MTTSATFRRDIQGLRAVAVGLVVAEHVLGVPRGGFVGVDVFFVISGYLIIGLLLREHDATRRIDLPAFALRRVRRLAPAAAVVLGATVLLAFAFLPAGRAEQTAVDAGWAAVLLANWHFAVAQTDYFAVDGPVSPLQHLWSLSVEEQFYIVVPVALTIVLGLAARSGRRGRLPATGMLFALLVASLVWAAHEHATGAPGTYFSTLARAWEPAVGGLLAISGRLWQRLPLGVADALGWAGLAAISVASIALDGSDGFPFPAALLPVLGSGLVIIAGSGAGRVGCRLLTLPPLVGLGAISYPLYLWHFPLLIIWSAIMPSSSWVTIPLAIVLAIGTHRLVERPLSSFPWSAGVRGPAGRLRRRLWASEAYSHQAPVAVLLVSGLACALGVVAFDHSAGSPVPSSGQPVAAEEDDELDQEADSPPAVRVRQELLTAALQRTSWPLVHPSIDDVTATDYLARLPRDPEWAGTLGCSITWSSESLDRCTFGDPDGRTVVLVGDSTGAFSAPALRAIAERAGSGWRLVNATRYSCPWVDEAISFVEDDGECEDHKRKILDVINQVHPDVVLVVNTPSKTEHDGAQVTHQQWAKWTAAMAARTGPVRTVAMVPNPAGPDVRTCAANPSPSACVTSDADNRARTRALEAELGDAVVDTSPIWCVTGRCPAFVEDRLARLDAVHAGPGAVLRAQDALHQLLATKGVFE
jgi:peptidoglycan/LPS O-acetylase OafA/YrhL